MQLLPRGFGRPLDIIPRTIVVYVGEGLIGDAFMRLPFAAELRQLYPAAEITWLFRDAATPSGRRIEPLLRQFCDEVLFDAAIGGAADELLQPAPFTGRRWDLLVDTQRVLTRAILISRIRHRRMASFAGRYLLSDVKPVFRKGESVKIRHYGEQLMSLLGVLRHGSLQGPSFLPAPLVLPDSLSAWIAGADAGVAGRVLIAPGAGGRHKCWPLERVADLGRRLQQNGQSVAYLLGPAEQEWAPQLAAATPEATFPLSGVPAHILAFEPLLTVGLAAASLATVAMDSGVGHMLAAGSPRHVCLFGPTEPSKFAPAARRLMVVNARTYGGVAMQDIPVEAVLAALSQLILENGASLC